jgi:protein-histidine N-methyltransferase
VPTLLLLDRLFTYLASEPGTSTGPPSSGDNDAGSRSDGSVPSAPVRETHIHLQDYNRSVLELVTFPNVLLAWCPSSHHLTSRHSCSLKDLPTDMSPLSGVYRASATDSDSDLDENEDENEEGNKATSGRRAGHGHKPGGLTVTQGLLDAFTASLDAHKVRLCFFAGSWASLREKLAHRRKPPYDIVLASETIYRPQSLDAFLGVLCTATATPTAMAVSDEVVQPPLCLVAAKVLYFGVGGGVQGFVRAVEGENGTLRTVWEHHEGVGRIIMQVEW